MDFTPADADLFAIGYVIYQRTSNPSGVAALRLALKIEDAFADISIPVPADRPLIEIPCSCGRVAAVRGADMPPVVRQFNAQRQLLDDGGVMVLADEEYAYLKECIERAQVNQFAVRLTMNFIDKIQAATKQSSA